MSSWTCCLRAQLGLRRLYRRGMRRGLSSRSSMVVVCIYGRIRLLSSGRSRCFYLLVEAPHRSAKQALKTKIACQMSISFRVVKKLRTWKMELPSTKRQIANAVLLSKISIIFATLMLVGCVPNRECLRKHGEYCQYVALRWRE